MKTIPLAEIRHNVLKLPRLPIPNVGDTLDLYIDSIKGIIYNESKLANHIAKVEKFREVGASYLQKCLVDADAACDNDYPYSYVEESWDNGYLGFRGSLAINLNPSIGIKKLGAVDESLLASQNRPEGLIDGREYVDYNGEKTRVFRQLTQAEVGAYWAHGIAKYMRCIIENGVESKVNGKGEPLDVSRMVDQFCTARIPKPDLDTKHHANWVDAGRRVTVLRNGHIFTVEVIDSEGQLIDLRSLTSAFQEIVRFTQANDKNTTPVTAFTVLPRDEWAGLRAELIKDPEDAARLNAIDSSIIIICLDTNEWKDVTHKRNNMLFGDVEQYESRWYDKHQIIVSSDAQVALNLEHSFSDALTWVHWSNAVYNDIQYRLLSDCADVPARELANIFTPMRDNLTTRTVAVSDLSKIIRPITFSIGKNQAGSIRNARAYVKQLTETVLTKTALLPFGSEDLKRLHFSPDAFMQIALHMAYARVHDGRIVSTYESCSTAAFFHGREEIIRSATPQLRSFVSAYLAQGSNESDLYDKAMTAMKRDTKWIRKASEGQGVDMHLLALKNFLTKNAGRVVVTEKKEKGEKNAVAGPEGSNIKAPLSCFNIGTSIPILTENDLKDSDPEMKKCYLAAQELFADQHFLKYNTFQLIAANLGIGGLHREHNCCDSYCMGPLTDSGNSVAYVINKYSTAVCFCNSLVDAVSDSGVLRDAFIDSATALKEILESGAKK